MGASLNGRASSLLRRGRPLDALPVYEANLALLGQTRGSFARELILQNLGQKVTALPGGVYQNPLWSKLAPRLISEDLPPRTAVLADYAAAGGGTAGDEG